MLFNFSEVFHFFPQSTAEKMQLSQNDSDGEDAWPASPSSSSSLNLQILKLSEKTIDLESQHSHRPRFKIDPRMISDAIIGLSDGLTVPFALTAGLSALGSTKIVVYGGLAELIAGSISMGMGGYLGAKSELESYNATLDQTRSLTVDNAPAVADTVSEIFTSYDLPPALVQQLSEHLTTSSHATSFLMRFSHQLPEPAASRALTCALTIALGYFIGGFVPLVPYFFVAGENAVYKGLIWSIGIMACALFGFGYVKTCLNCGWRGWGNAMAGVRGGGEMVVVGGVAAGAAMGLVKAFGCWEGTV